jgi:hypothetical protein
MFAWTVRTMNTMSNAATTMSAIPTAISMGRPSDQIVARQSGRSGGIMRPSGRADKGP